METGKQQQQPQKSKEQASHSMKLGAEDKQKEMSSAQTANELKSLSQTNQYIAYNFRQRKVNDKEVQFLVRELGVDKIKAGNLLKKLQLKQAVLHVLNN